MDPRQLELFQALYAEVAGYKLSHRDRNERKTEERSFVYGEVQPESFAELVAYAAPQPGERFVDLGCGIGKAVLLAALQFPFAKSIGVELLPSLVQACEDAREGVDARLRPTLSSERQGVEVEFLEGDLRGYDLSQVDVAFAHCSCFEKLLMDALTEKLLGELRPGGRVVLVGRFLYRPELERLFHGKCEMDWGEADAAVYRKL